MLLRSHHVKRNQPSRLRDFRAAMFYFYGRMHHRCRGCGALRGSPLEGIGIDGELPARGELAGTRSLVLLGDVLDA